MSDYWNDNNIVKPQQRIVCAACKLDEVIVCSARHFDPRMHAQCDMMPDELRWARAEQGFINQFGEFLNRKEAMQVVKEKRSTV